MIAGPYRGNTQDKTVWDYNLKILNEVAFEVFEKGHTPIVGVNLAKPIIDLVGQHSYDELMMPICLSIADKCDAVLRVGDKSIGADMEVDVFKKKKLPIYTSIEQLP